MRDACSRVGKATPDTHRCAQRSLCRARPSSRLATNREFWKLLEALLAERNAEHHGGIKGPGERKQKLARLESSLAELRSLTQAGVQDVKLMRPGDGGYRLGVTEYRKALLLSGYADAFSQVPLASLQQLEADQLY